ncbi:Acyltransferase ChoActase/COT/CPT [Tylopilus felleus]
MSNQVRPQNWKALAPPIPNFAHQSSTLPRLPLPPLEVTLQRLKDSLRPLARSTEEFASVCRKIDDFGRADGPGPVLQQMLLQRKNEADSWLEELWDDFAFLGSRSCLPYYMSPYAGFEPQPAHLPQTPAARAAGLTYATMLFRQRLRSGKLAPETINGVELCMNSYRFMFDSCRIPGAQGTDWLVSYAGSPNPDHDLGHVIVIRKNRFWKVKAQVGDTVVGMGDLIRQFQYIYDHTTEEYPAVGVLTAHDRDTWAKDLALLSSVLHNAAILREIESSAFVVSLDDSTPPENDVDISRALLHGTLPSPTNPTGISRGLDSCYFDKPFQFIVFDNCVAGQIGEHSIVDGTHYFHLCDDLLGFLADPKSDFQLSPSPSVVAVPQPLDFDLTSIPEIHEAISKAQLFVHDLASSKSLSFVRTSYGKAAIKAFGVGPDGWAQMIVQVAYARLAERFGGENSPVAPWPVCTFEAAMTRTFYKGRDESVRVVTDECVAFVRAMLGNTATKDEKVRLLKAAVRKNQQLASAAAKGNGVDRPVVGFLVAKPPSMPEPELFTDPLFTRSTDGTIFTTCVFSSHIRQYGWGAFNDNGFGIPYMTGSDDYLQFTITSGSKMPNAAFAEEINKAADEFYQLFVSGPSGRQSEERNINAKL